MDSNAICTRFWCATMQVVDARALIAVGKLISFPQNVRIHIEFTSWAAIFWSYKLAALHVYMQPRCFLFIRRPRVAFIGIRLHNFLTQSLTWASKLEYKHFNVPSLGLKILFFSTPQNWWRVGVLRALGRLNCRNGGYCVYSLWCFRVCFELLFNINLN